MIEENCVLLLKTQVAKNETDNYEELLRAHNFEVRKIKTLDFTFTNLDQLQKELNDPDSFSGLLFSSPRCVEAVFRALKYGKIDEKWHKKLNYVVGETTYKEVLDKIGLDCLGKESGNALNLSKVIVANRGGCNKPFLFPHGNLKTDTLKAELSKQGLDVTGVLVYETIPNPTLASDFTRLTENFRKMPEYIVLFSPSGLNYSLEYLKKFSKIGDIKLVAIGPVTEGAIIKNKMKVYAVARNPTPLDVLNAIKSV